MSRRRIVFAVVVAGCFVAAPASFGETPFDDLPKPRIKNPLALNGSFATAWGKLRTLDPEKYREHEIEFSLADGTRTGGLMFYRADRRPLLICTLGFLTDRWSHASGHWIRRFVAKERINAHVLVLDHPTSSVFYARNGHLSAGGHDEGRILVEVARRMRARDDANRISTIHLLGVSMGGMGVVHALLEDDRLGAKLFSSAIVLSAVTDYSTSPTTQLSHFTNKEDPRGPWGKKIRSRRRHSQRHGINFLFKRFRRVVGELTGTPLEVAKPDTGEFFYEAFSARLEFLRTAGEHADAPWNPDFPRDSLEAYMASCDLTRHIRDLSIPLLMVHAKDDPVIPYDQLQRVEFAGNEKDHPFLTTVGVQQGGHFGFTTVYRSEWLLELIRRTLQVQI